MNSKQLNSILDSYPALENNPKVLKKMGREDRIHQAFAWCRERHAIYLRRNVLELPAPWSSSPVMSGTRWCNVYRELDRVTQEFLTEVYTPNRDNPNLWFVAMVCRYINYPDSIRDLLKANQLGLNRFFDWRKAAEVLNKRKLAKKQFITGAYLVNSVSSADFPDDIRGSKPHVIMYRLSKAWEEKDKVLTTAKGFKTSMEAAYEGFSSISGFGPFLSYQALVDLSYFPEWLGKSKDFNKFNSAGPGTKRGYQRLHYGRQRESFEPVDQEEVTDFLREFLAYSKDPNFWPQTSKDPAKGFAPLSMSNSSNVMCEVDKWQRVILGEGKTRSKYVAVQSGDLF